MLGLVDDLMPEYLFNQEVDILEMAQGQHLFLRRISTFKHVLLEDYVGKIDIQIYNLTRTSVYRFKKS